MPDAASGPEGGRRHPARGFAHGLLGVGVLAFLCLAGEGLATLIDVPIPGAVLGLILLILLLLSPLGDRIERAIAPGADALIVMLPLLLVPLAVGVLELVDALGTSAVGLLITLLAGWLAAFGVTVALHLSFRRTVAK